MGLHALQALISLLIAAAALTIENVETPGRAVSSCAAGSLSADEQAQLRRTASGLPTGWVLTLDPPWGQVRIQPIGGTHWHHRCFAAGPSGKSGPLNACLR